MLKKIVTGAFLLMLTIPAAGATTYTKDIDGDGFLALTCGQIEIPCPKEALDMGGVLPDPFEDDQDDHNALVGSFCNQEPSHYMCE